MFKYTACPNVLTVRDRLIKNSKRPWDAEYFYALEITGSPSAYFLCGNFWRNYENLEFYSKNKLKEVPVNGVLIPVNWFHESIVQ